MAKIKNPVTIVQQGGNSGGDSNGKYLVQVVDPYGNIIKENHLNTGEIFELPNAPMLDRLTFQEYSSPVAITNNTITVENSDITIGAVYTTTSGKSEFDISVTKTTGLEVSIAFSGEIDWGDGTTETTSSSPSTHTYTDYGSYIVSISNLTTINSYFIGTSSGSNCTLTDVRLANGVTSISDYAFYQCNSLKNITLSNSVTSIGGYSFERCYILNSITIPSGVTMINSSTFSTCHSLKSVTIPSSVYYIGNYSFLECYCLTSITIHSNISYIGTQSFQNCLSLNIDITLPSGVSGVGNAAFQSCYIKSIKMPSIVYSIQGYTFSNCHLLLKYDFSNATQIPNLANINAFNNINKLSKIIVPDTLYDQWIVANNWSTYADYIYKASEVIE